MLDLGQADFAFKIAQTALDLWKAEVDDSYDCFEHFLIKSGRGAGWHQFSVLSSPVLAWFAAYYRPGRLTTGFDTWIHHCRFRSGNDGLKAELELRGGSDADAVLLATLEPGQSYSARWNGKPAPVRSAGTPDTGNPSAQFAAELKGSAALQVTLPRNSGRGQLEVGVVPA